MELMKQWERLSSGSPELSRFSPNRSLVSSPKYSQYITESPKSPVSPTQPFAQRHSPSQLRSTSKYTISSSVFHKQTSDNWSIDPSKQVEVIPNSSSTPPQKVELAEDLEDEREYQ